MKQVAGREEVDLDRLVGHWVLDSSLSKVRFAERIFWGLVKVQGRFTAFSGSGTVESEGRVTGSVKVEAASLDTENDKRDEHLQSSDFFDVVRHPLPLRCHRGCTGRRRRCSVGAHTHAVEMGHSQVGGARRERECI